jgi:DNA polymerase-3 subunit gamma/tau
VQVAGNWMGMVQTRSNLLEQAVANALGGNRQLVLEASSGSVAPAPVAAAPTPKPVTPPAIQPVVPPTTPGATTTPPKPGESAKVDPIPPPVPTAAPDASAKPAAPTKLPHLEQPIARPADPKPTPEPQAPHKAAADIERHAKTLANFFNGEVLAVDDIGTGTNAQQSEAKNPEQL